MTVTNSSIPGQVYRGHNEQVLPAGAGNPVQTGTTNIFSGLNGFTQGLLIGTGAVTARQPVLGDVAINPAQAGLDDHIGYVLKTHVDGPWAEATGFDPNMAWGMNVFSIFQNDQNGLLTGWGALIEADISSDAASTINHIIGLQAEASFFGPSAGATVTTLESMYVAPPARKNGAVGGVGTNTYGLRIGPVIAANTGATSALSLFVQGSGVVDGAAQSLFQGTVSIGLGRANDVGFIVRAAAAPAGDLIQLKDSTAAILSRFNKAGYFMTKKTVVPADADLTNGELALWLDPTNGAAKLMIKAKQTDGTVRTGSVALA